MPSASVLARHARRLNRQAGAPAIPALYFLTDPQRTPDPLAAARRLPRGTAVIYRHFGAANRARIAAELARICRQNGLFLLISADPSLARSVGANGVHWPEKRAQRARGFGLQTMAAHSPAALRRAAALGIDAALLSPVLPTASPSPHGSLGALRAGQLARAALLPVIALGGVTTHNARSLSGRGFAGLASVGALSGA